MSSRKAAIVEQYQDSHPAIGPYLECVSRAYLNGLAGFGLSFSCCYLVQRLSPFRLPYTANGQLLLAALVASGVAYKVTSDRTQHCQNAWMAAEDKHTFFNPIGQRNTRPKTAGQDSDQ